MVGAGSGAPTAPPPSFIEPTRGRPGVVPPPTPPTPAAAPLPPPPPSALLGVNVAAGEDVTRIPQKKIKRHKIMKIKVKNL